MTLKWLTSDNLSMAIGYLTLVGIPLLATVFVMNAGGRITAPVSIGGDWVIQPPSSGAVETCLEGLSLAAGRTLAISQSGRFLKAHFPEAPTREMVGLIDQRQFTLCALGDVSRECSLSSLHLTGRILEHQGARRLELRLKPGLAECQQVVLHSAWRPIKAPRPPQRGYNY